MSGLESNLTKKLSRASDTLDLDSYINELYHELYTPIREVILARVLGFPGNPVEDLIQEVFSKIIQRKAELKNVKNIHPWAMRITNNVLNDFYRRVNGVSHPDRNPRKVDPIKQKHDGKLNGYPEDHLSYDHLGTVSLTSNINNGHHDEDFSHEGEITSLIEEFSNTLNAVDKEIFLMSSSGETLLSIYEKFPDISKRNITLKLFKIRKKLVAFAREKGYVVNEETLQSVLNDIRHDKSFANRRPKGSVTHK